MEFFSSLTASFISSAGGPGFSVGFSGDGWPRLQRWFFGWRVAQASALVFRVPHARFVSVGLFLVPFEETSPAAPLSCLV